MQTRNSGAKSASEIAVAAPAGAHLTYFGGPVISNVHVVQVLYGSGSYNAQVAGSTSPTMGNFYGDLTELEEQIFHVGTILTGGSGHDTFAFPNLMGHDEVTNFGLAKDTLQFNASLFANFAAAMTSATQVGANTVFTIDGGDTVTLDNVARSSLTSSNFHFS